MRRGLSYLAVMLSICCMTGCAKTHPVIEEGTKVTYQKKYEILGADMADRLDYQSLEEELSYATGIFEGQVISETSQYVDTWYNEELKKDLPCGGYTVYLVKVIKPLEGEYKAGDSVLVKQGYFLAQGSKGTVCSAEGLEVPVNKGDKAIFAIDKRGDTEEKWVLDKYPIPSKDVINMPKEKYTTEILGSTEVTEFKCNIYDQICEKYYR